MFYAFVKYFTLNQSMIIFNLSSVSCLSIQCDFIFRQKMRRILVFLEIIIPIWAVSGDVFLAENVQKAKLENQKLAQKIQQRLNENDIQQLFKNLAIEETEKFHSENEVNSLSYYLTVTWCKQYLNKNIASLYFAG